MNIYEMYGRLAEERHVEHLAHLRTIQVLSDLKSGAIALEQVEVVGESWSIKAPPVTPFPRSVE